MLLSFISRTKWTKSSGFRTISRFYRDGEYIATDRAENLNVDKVIQLMVGREVNNMFSPKGRVSDRGENPFLKVGKILSARPAQFKKCFRFETASW